MKVRMCHIDKESDESIGLEAERPEWKIRILGPKEYGCWILMIHLGTRIIEIATGEGC